MIVARAGKAETARSQSLMNFHSEKVLERKQIDYEHTRVERLPLSPIFMCISHWQICRAVQHSMLINVYMCYCNFYRML